MKKTKIIVPALGMLLLSTAASVTGTVAWFSMNTTVTASNMKVQAKAEKGLLINETDAVADTTWDELAVTNQTNPAVLYPSSTIDGSTWYHAASKKSNSAAGATSSGINADLVGGEYETLSGLVAITDMSKSAVAGTTAAYTTYGKSADSEAGYYVNYVYYLKSSADAITLGASTNQYVQISRVEATLPATDSSASANLNKSLRVGVKLNSVFYIYAPVSGYTSTYYVGGTSSATVHAGGTASQTDKVNTDLGSLPASSAKGTAVNVFIWYEGEDANCMSDNAKAATLDSITIDIDFSLVTTVSA